MNMLKKCFEEQDSVGLLSKRNSRLPTRIQALSIAWSQSPMDMVKVNVDGASRRNSGWAACGCVIHDHDGRWIIGAATNLGICSAYQAGLWGVLSELRLA